MRPHPPPLWQTFAGRQAQVTVAPHDAGRVVQKGAGGVQGGSSQPGPGVGEVLQKARYVHPVGHWPPSGSGLHRGAVPPQLGRTQSSLLVHARPPHTAAPPVPPPEPPRPALPPDPPRPPAPAPSPPRPPEPVVPPRPPVPPLPDTPPDPDAPAPPSSGGHATPGQPPTEHAPVPGSQPGHHT